MRLLLDTHAVLWWFAGDRRLSGAARRAIGAASSEVLVSCVTGWEITTKYRIGKLPEAAVIAADVEAAVRGQGFAPLDLSMRHAEHAGRMPGKRRDPFDRMLAAQAILENLLLVTNDPAFEPLGVSCLW